MIEGTNSCASCLKDGCTPQTQLASITHEQESHLEQEREAIQMTVIKRHAKGFCNYLALSINYSLE